MSIKSEINTNQLKYERALKFIEKYPYAKLIHNPLEIIYEYIKFLKDPVIKDFFKRKSSITYDCDEMIKRIEKMQDSEFVIVTYFACFYITSLDNLFDYLDKVFEYEEAPECIISVNTEQFIIIRDSMHASYSSLDPDKIEKFKTQKPGLS